MKRIPMMVLGLLALPLVAAEAELDVDIKPLAGRVYGVRKAEKVDSTTIRVTLGAVSTPLARKMTEGWRIVSREDAAYAYAKFVQPTAATEVGDEVEFAYPKAWRPNPAWRRPPQMKRTVIELKLPTPMKPGAKYGVVAMGGVLNAARGEQECVTGGTTGAFVGEDYGADAAAARVVGVRNALSAGGGVILVEVGNALAAEAAESPANWTVTVNGQAKAVRAVGRRSRLDFYYPGGWPFTGMVLHDVFLDLGEPLKTGDKVAVKAAADIIAGNDSFAFTFNEKKSVSRSIQANQVGYLPEGVKIAYLGQWMGSMRNPGNSLTLAAPPAFEVVNAKTGKTAFSGTAVFTHAEKDSEGRANMSASNVWELDFTRLAEPGEYYVSVKGVGRSLNFKIHKNAYLACFKRIMQGIYEQRCGCPLDPKLTGGWARISCHDKGVKESNVARWEFNQYGPFQNRCTGKVIDVKGGHHDAGDYNPRSHLDVAQALMDAFELKPGNFADSQLGVPEKGNGIPDVLDEALWQLRLWVGLQDADGGVHDGTESHADPHFFQTVEMDDKGDYAFAKNARASFFCAGAFAQASRLLAKCGKQKEAADFLNRAKSAYAWAKANPPPADKTRTWYTDPLVYAAAQLFVTTGDEAYHADFKKDCVWSANPRSELSSWGKYDQSRAALAYLMAPEAKADKAIREGILAAAKGEVEMFINGSSKCAYKFLRNPYAPINWGTGAYENYAVTCAHLYAHTGDAKYRDWLIRTCDNTLGANPMGISYIKGLGARTIRCPLHNSRYRPEGVPVDGLEGQGPVAQAPGYSVKDTLYPAQNDNFAQLHTFVDLHFAIAMDEPTVNNMANTALVFGVLAK